MLPCIQFYGTVIERGPQQVAEALTKSQQRILSVVRIVDLTQVKSSMVGLHTTRPRGDQMMMSRAEPVKTRIVPVPDSQVKSTSGAPRPGGDHPGPASCNFLPPALRGLRDLIGVGR